MREFYIQYDDGTSRLVPLDRDRIVIGRGESADVVSAADFALSREHCAVERHGDAWALSDLRSRNHTFLNGRAIQEPERLRVGDVIVAGHLVFYFRDSETAANGLGEMDLELTFGDSYEGSDDTAVSDVSAEPSEAKSPTRSADMRPSGIAWLDIQSGRRYGERVPLTKSFTSGRRQDCNLVIASQTVSRLHARILLEDQQYYVYNAGKGHTYINGKPVLSRQLLRDRDEIRISKMVLLFVQPVGDEEISPAGRRRLVEFEQEWQRLTDAARLSDKDAFSESVRRLFADILCEAMGLRLIEPIGWHDGIAGYIVQAPGLRIKTPRFPILVIAYDDQASDLRASISVIVSPGDYFVIAVPVPVRETSDRTVQSLRAKLVNPGAKVDFAVLNRDELAQLIAARQPESLLRTIVRQGIDLSVLSPYRLAAAVPGHMFFGREQEIKTIRLGLPETSFAIIGPRKIGKSSILQHIGEGLSWEPGYRVFRVSCEHIFDQSNFLETMEADLGISAKDQNPASFYDMVVHVRRLDPGSTIVFLLDEFDHLLDRDAQPVTEFAGKLAHTFRALSGDGVCRFVFSGNRVLQRAVEDSSSPFFNFCKSVTLSTLNPSSVADLITSPMLQLGIEFENQSAVVERIVDLSSCHPNIAQWFCDNLLKTLSEHRLTLDHVEQVSESRGFREHYIRTALAEADAEPLERLITLLMEDEFSLADVMARLDATGIRERRRIARALHMLEFGSMLEQTEATRYRFRMQHYPAFVRACLDVEAEREVLATQASV